MDKKYSLIFVGIFISFIFTPHLCIGAGFTANPLLAQGSGRTEESKTEILQIVKEKVVSPQGARCGRAEVIVVNNRIFLAFNNLDANPRSFQLVELNEDLSYQGPIIDLFSDSGGRKFPTDIRLAGDGKKLWYAFETVLGRQVSCDNHCLNMARYNISGTEPKLEDKKVDIVRGCPTTRNAYLNPPPPDQIPKNPEAVDDPTPIFHNGKYVILTRAWRGGVQHIRTFDKDFNMIEDFTLDLSPLIGNRSLSQNALVDIEGQIYLIGGLFDGPPFNPNSNSDIYAIPLTNDLHSVAGEMIPLLKHPGKYYTKVTAARYKDGRLYINYALAKKGGGQFHYLGVFDMKNGFTSLAQVQFQLMDKSVTAPHSSIEVLGNKVFAVYPGGDEGAQILARVYQWQKHITGKTNTDYPLLYKKEEIPASDYKDSPFGISIAGFLGKDYEKSLEYMKEAGAGTVRFMSNPRWGALSWAHIEPVKGVYDWLMTDERYLKAKEIGLDMMVNIYPSSPKWDPNYEENVIMQYPGDMNAYLDFISQAAERYDGDGINDALGSPVVTYWEIGVEMWRGEGWSAKHGGKIWFGGTPEKYADLFVRTYKAIKSANPNAVVGMAGANPLRDLETGTNYEETLLQKTKELTKDIPDFSFVYGLHFYPGGKGNFDTYAEMINVARATLNENGFYNVPIAITDMAPFLLKDDPLKEQKVAKDIIEYNVFGLARDMKIIIWAQLSDGLDAVYGKKFEAGLISTPSMSQRDEAYYKNLGFYTYKLMVDKLEGSDWSNIQTVQESDGIYIYKFSKSNKPIWVAWGDYPKIINLKVNSDKVTITEAIPAAENSAQLTKEAIFRTEVKEVSKGYVFVPLGSNPVYIEEGKVPAPVYKVEKVAASTMPKQERPSHRERTRPISGRVRFN